MLALNCLKVLCYCDKCSSFLTSQKVPHDVVGFISTHYVFLRAGLIFTRFYTMRFLVPYLLIEEYESQEWARHRPLVTAIFKHDHIQNSTQDLLQDLWMQFKYLQEHVTGCRYTPTSLLSCENHCKVLKKNQHYPNSIMHKYIIKINPFPVTNGHICYNIQ